MRTIAIINQKGGVGTTTTAVNLSAALARAGQRVGLIDVDPQAHASLHLGLDPRSSVPTVYDLLTEETRIADLWQRAGSSKTEEENLWVAASHIDLAAVEVELAGVVGREVILRDKLKEAETQIKLGIAADPTRAWYFYTYGNFLRQQKKLKEAKAAFEEALRLDPDYIDAKDRLDMVKLEIG